MGDGMLSAASEGGGRAAERASWKVVSMADVF